MFDSVYAGVTLLGLLHGLEPGHGWPIAVLYSVRKRNPTLHAFISAGVIGLGHLVSSIAVVIAFVILHKWLDFDFPWLKYVAGALLLLLAVKLFTEKTLGMEQQHGHIHSESPDIEHEHTHKHPAQAPHAHWHKHITGIALSLWGLVTFAFVLGFAHEEEFALLALVASGANAWALMLSYGVAVLFGLIFVTVSCVKLYKAIHERLAAFEKWVPKISAVILAIMAIIVMLV